MHLQRQPLVPEHIWRLMPLLMRMSMSVSMLGMLVNMLLLLLLLPADMLIDMLLANMLLVNMLLANMLLLLVNMLLLVNKVNMVVFVPLPLRSGVPGVPPAQPPRAELWLERLPRHRLLNKLLKRVFADSAVRGGALDGVEGRDRLAPTFAQLAVLGKRLAVHVEKHGNFLLAENVARLAAALHVGLKRARRGVGVLAGRVAAEAVLAGSDGGARGGVKGRRRGRRDGGRRRGAAAGGRSVADARGR